MRTLSAATVGKNDQFIENQISPTFFPIVAAL